MEYKVVKYVDYQENEGLIQEIMNLIEPSYKQAGEHIKHDIEVCNELYAIHSEEKELLAFFMVGFHKIDDLNCYYGGLSACKNELKKSGVVKLLYHEYLRDCIKMELELNQRIITYWTTATPIVYYLTHRYWTNVQPMLDGNCTDIGREILFKIACHSYSHATFSENTPFVLRKAAKQINYSDFEKDRIMQAAKDLNLNVFEKYEIDENNGDRFLMFGYAPSHEELIRRTLL